MLAWWAAAGDGCVSPGPRCSLHWLVVALSIVLVTNSAVIGVTGNSFTLSFITLSYGSQQGVGSLGGPVGMLTLTFESDQAVGSGDAIHLTLPGFSGTSGSLSLAEHSTGVSNFVVSSLYWDDSTKALAITYNAVCCGANYAANEAHTTTLNLGSALLLPAAGSPLYANSGTLLISQSGPGGTIPAQPIDFSPPVLVSDASLTFPWPTSKPEQNSGPLTVGLTVATALAAGDTIVINMPGWSGASTSTSSGFSGPDAAAVASVAWNSGANPPKLTITLASSISSATAMSVTLPELGTLTPFTGITSTLNSGAYVFTITAAEQAPHLIKASATTFTSVVPGFMSSGLSYSVGSALGVGALGGQVGTLSLTITSPFALSSGSVMTLALPGFTGTTGALSLAGHSTGFPNFVVSGLSWDNTNKVLSISYNSNCCGEEYAPGTQYTTTLTIGSQLSFPAATNPLPANSIDVLLALSSSSGSIPAQPVHMSPPVLVSAASLTFPWPSSKPGQASGALTVGLTVDTSLVAGDIIVIEMPDWSGAGSTVSTGFSGPDAAAVASVAWNSNTNPPKLTITLAAGASISAGTPISFTTPDLGTLTPYTGITSTLNSGKYVFIITAAAQSPHLIKASATSFTSVVPGFLYSSLAYLGGAVPSAGLIGSPVGTLQLLIQSPFDIINQRIVLFLPELTGVTGTISISGSSTGRSNFHVSSINWDETKKKLYIEYFSSCCNDYYYSSIAYTTTLIIGNYLTITQGNMMNSITRKISLEDKINDQSIDISPGIALSQATLWFSNNIAATATPVGTISMNLQLVHDITIPPLGGKIIITLPSVYSGTTQTLSSSQIMGIGSQLSIIDQISWDPDNYQITITLLPGSMISSNQPFCLTTSQLTNIQYPSNDGQFGSGLYKVSIIIEDMVATSATFATVTPTSNYQCSASSIIGDPMFHGYQGQIYQFHGIPNEWFQLITTPSMMMNAYFVYLTHDDLPDPKYCNETETPCWTHPGTYLKDIAIQICEIQIMISAGSPHDGLSIHFLDNTIDASFQWHSTYTRTTNITQSHHNIHQQLTNCDLDVSIISSHSISVETSIADFKIYNSNGFVNIATDLKNSQLLRMGQQRYHIIDDLEQPYPILPIHGLIGQTWKNAEYAHHQLYQGVPDDYLVTSGTPFGCETNISQHEWCHINDESDK